MTELDKFTPYTPEELAALDSSQRAAMAASLLEGLEPARQPLELFKQLARLTVASAVELVPIRTVRKRPEIWLGRRSESDPWWPNKWVLPGVVVLPSDTQNADKTLEGPIKRLFEDDLQGIEQIDALHQLPTQFRFDDRGHEVTTQYWTHVQTGSEPYEGRFFELDDLQDPALKADILSEGLLTIDRAIEGYYESQRTHEE